MPRHNPRLILAIVSAAALAACAEQSPFAPGTAADLAEGAGVLAQPVVGSYELDFSSSGSELILTAHVEDSQGNPAQEGFVVFQYCSYKGLPPGDPSQPDEAPSSACEDGSATWATLAARIPVDASGDASLDFGVVSIVEVIGFRYRYVGQGSGIANWTTEGEDWIGPL